MYIIAVLFVFWINFETRTRKNGNEIKRSGNVRGDLALTIPFVLIDSVWHVLHTSYANNGRPDGIVFHGEISDAQQQTEPGPRGPNESVLRAGKKKNPSHVHVSRSESIARTRRPITARANITPPPPGLLASLPRVRLFRRSRIPRRISPRSRGIGKAPQTKSRPRYAHTDRGTRNACYLIYVVTSARSRTLRVFMSLNCICRAARRRARERVNGKMFSPRPVAALPSEYVVGDRKNVRRSVADSPVATGYRKRDVWSVSKTRRQRSPLPSTLRNLKSPVHRKPAQPFIVFVRGSAFANDASASPFKGVCEIRTESRPLIFFYSPAIQPYR